MCGDFNKAKAYKLSFSISSNNVTAPLEVIHTDMWDPALVYQALVIGTMCISLMDLPDLVSFIHVQVNLMWYQYLRRLNPKLKINYHAPSKL
jgi:hypothetical protein